MLPASGGCTDAEAHDGRASPNRAAPDAVTADDAAGGRRAVIGVSGYLLCCLIVHSRQASAS